MMEEDGEHSPKNKEESLATDQTWTTKDRETEAVSLRGLGEKQQTAF